MRLGSLKISSFKMEEIADLRPESEILEEEAQSFLKTIKGLRYLQMKFPSYTLVEAVREYKYQLWAAYKII